MDVRSRILNAALGLLAEGGAQELTQPRICKAAGVRQSHLTYYFPTISDLLQAVAKHSLEALAAELERSSRRRPAALPQALAKGTSDKRRVRVMLGLVAAAERDAAVRRRLRAFIEELRAGFAPALQAGGLSTDAGSIAFIHTVAIGAAVLQLARDNAAARREARAVLKIAVQCIAQRR